MRAWLIQHWDWFIYHRAYHSLRRMCERNGGFAYMLELWIREFRRRHPISPQLERATEEFFASQLETMDKNAKPTE